jgi:hypothetical protein
MVKLTLVYKVFQSTHLPPPPPKKKKTLFDFRPKKPSLHTPSKNQRKQKLLISVKPSLNCQPPPLPIFLGKKSCNGDHFL